MKPFNIFSQPHLHLFPHFSVGDFEYTSESTIFDLMSISLYHGWLVDPQDEATVRAVKSCSYNQLVERIIEMRGSQEEENVTHGEKPCCGCWQVSTCM